MSTTFDPTEALALADQRQLAGDLRGAIGLYAGLLDRSPAYWPAYANRGLAFALAGDNRAAHADFRRALAIEPAAAPALRNLADSLQGDAFESALALARALVAVAPLAAESWLSLGGVELSGHRHLAAARALRRALALAPATAEALTALGLASDDAALPWLSRAITTRLAHAPLLALARHINAHGDRSIGWRLLRRALVLSPGDVEAMVELTGAIDGFRAPDELYRWGQRALSFAPEAVAVRNNLGTASLALGHLAEAECHFAEATRRRPDFAEAHFNRATPLFLLGRDDEAWSEYEWRWRIERFEKAPSAAPRWSGEPLDGRRLLVHEEQGLGDSLQFVRYLPELATQHPNFTFLCHPRLERLLRGSFPDIAISAKPAVPDHDVAVGLLSLPRLLRRAGRPAPASPYLKTPQVHRIEAQGRLRVGLAWSGNLSHPRNHERSIPLACLEPWLETPGIAWFSLQFGPQTADIAKSGFSHRIADLGSRVPDLQDTAAALAGLDLLISIDTAFCHLAGALGVPVWTLLHWLPDWRWGLTGSTTAWYPSMRLFRQPSRGAWQPVLAEVKDALAGLRSSLPQDRIDPASAIRGDSPGSGIAEAP
jgi:tetratricopeptide (TPR) repeat protein